MKPILLQTQDGQLSIEGRLVYQYCMMNDVPAIKVDYADLASKRLDLKLFELAVGSVEFISEALTQIQCKIPKPNYYPDCLTGFMRRKHWVTNIGFYRDFDELPDNMFVKSFDWKKLDGKLYKKAELKNQDEWMVIHVCEPVSFRSESRVYAQDKKIICIAQYAGEDDELPDEQTICEAVTILSAQESTPCAYAIDFGVLDDGRTALVEMNDGWAIGAYKPIGYREYTDFLIARWKQMTTIT